MIYTNPEDARRRLRHTYVYYKDTVIWISEINNDFSSDVFDVLNNKNFLLENINSEHLHPKTENIGYMNCHVGKKIVESLYLARAYGSLKQGLDFSQLYPIGEDGPKLLINRTFLDTSRNIAYMMLGIYPSLENIIEEKYDFAVAFSKTFAYDFKNDLLYYKSFPIGKLFFHIKKIELFREFNFLKEFIFCNCFNNFMEV